MSIRMWMRMTNNEDDYENVIQMSESPTLPGWYNTSISLADRCKLPKVCSNMTNVIISVTIVVINILMISNHHTYLAKQHGFKL